MDVTRPKSPAAPSASLSEAVNRLADIYAKEKRGPIDKDTAMSAMGYSRSSGAGLRMLATLGQYGLIERQSAGHVRVTDLGMDILLPSDAQQELEARRQASRKPEIFVELLERYSNSGGLPSDSALVSYLVKRTPIPFGDASARSLARAFRETLEFTEARKDDTESNGGKGGTTSNGDEQPPVGQTPKPTPPNRLGLAAGDSNTRTDTFILGEGAMVALQYPATLSQASYQDFEDWIGLELRKIKRLITSQKESHEKEQATDAEA